MKLRHFRADMSEWTAALLLALVLLMPAAASAQNPPAPATSDQQVLKPEQLDALVAHLAGPGSYGIDLPARGGAG